MSAHFVHSRMRVERNKIIHIKRRLEQGYGLLKVHVGYEVTPDTVLGEGQSFAGFKVVDLAKELGIGPTDGLMYLKKKIGQTIFQGELIAEREAMLGLSKKRVFAESDGILESYDNAHGQLKIHLSPRRSHLVSGVYGVVDSVDIKKGEVLIRTQADVVHGVLGSGRERAGTLRFLVDNPSLLVSSRQVSLDFSGQIIVGGSIVFADALQKCVSLGIAAMITGGINAKDYRSISGGTLNTAKPHWTDVGVSLLVTEGFGSVPIGEDIYQVLKDYEGRFCILDGNTRVLILPTKDQNSMINIRKTHLPAGAGIESVHPVTTVNVKVGDRVRIVADGGFGQQGVVEFINQTPTLLPTGVAVIMVTVHTKTDKFQVPIINVEAI